jgi:hypothetical protein
MLIQEGGKGTIDEKAKSIVETRGVNSKESVPVF